MSRPAQSERRGLADDAVRFGPDAPTLCSPWRVADLLAHLILRESRPDLALGISVPALAGRLEKAQDVMAATTDFDTLVQRVRTGPPVWFPTRLGPVDEAANLTEMFVHHEDIRRANGLGPRTDYGAVEPALRGWLRRMGALCFRHAEVGVTLVADGGREQVVHRPTSLGAVVLRGPAPELVLYAFDRRDVALVQVQARPSEAHALRRSRIGLL